MNQINIKILTKESLKTKKNEKNRQKWVEKSWKIEKSSFAPVPALFVFIRFHSSTLRNSRKLKFLCFMSIFNYLRKFLCVSKLGLPSINYLTIPSGKLPFTVSIETFLDDKDLFLSDLILLWKHWNQTFSQFQPCLMPFPFEPSVHLSYRKKSFRDPVPPNCPHLFDNF